MSELKSFYQDLGTAALVAIVLFGATSKAQTAASTILNVDHESLVSRACEC